MTHQRIRPYEHSLKLDDEEFEYELCMAVKVGNRIWLRGQTGLDFEGTFVGEGDAAAQAENAMKCSDELLREAGSSLSDVVKTTVYLTDRAYRVPVFKVLSKWFGSTRPCQTGLIVNGLARPEMLMEIDIEAVIAS